MSQCKDCFHWRQLGKTDIGECFGKVPEVVIAPQEVPTLINGIIQKTIELKQMGYMRLQTRGDTEACDLPLFQPRGAE